MERLSPPETYERLAFPQYRVPVLETLQVWGLRHPIHGLLDVDVTLARRLIDEQAARTGEKLSFTGYVIACLGQAVAENKAVQARRNWRNELIVFDDVDVSTVIEVTAGERRFPVPYIVRAANRKSVLEIHAEIRTAQARPREPSRGRSSAGKQVLRRLPGFARRSLYRIMSGNPVWMKRTVGTVALTAVGMFGRGGGWGIPIAITPVFVTLGGIAPKPSVVDGQVAVRECLSLTLTFDHDTVDGAPAARFAGALQALLESGAGLAP
jgi:pyruvate/2-oxoglutarate dehydrogenase complex dihydrolipoamide acyltransferase (E2) component